MITKRQRHRGIKLTPWFIASMLQAASFLDDATAYQVVKVINGGTIQGEVKYVGRISKPKLIPVTKDPDHCGHGGLVEDEALIVSADGGIKNAIIILEGITKGKGFEQNVYEATLRMVRCVFYPHVQVLPPGSNLIMSSQDEVLHTIHGYLGRRTIFNLAFPLPGKLTKKLRRAKSGDFLRFLCDEHGWMLAYMLVLDHPYFAISDESGSFEIKDIPAGTYTLRAWHEYLGEQSKQVVVPPGEWIQVNFEYSTQK